TGAATNVAFNAWFVAFLGWGLAGAAFGTALAQLVQAAVLCRYFTSPERTLRFAARQTRWLQLLKASYAGAAEFINEVSAGAIIWCINALLLARMGVEGVAAFGVVNYYVFASLMLAYGISDALHLLVSQNYGAGRRERIRAFADTALRCALILGVLLAALFVGARGPLARWFLDAGETSITELAGRLCLIVWPLFVVSSANIALSCYLTAIQQPGPSASIALLRGLFLPLALLWSLARLSEPGPGGLGLPNWSFLLALPLAEWLTFGWAMFLRHRFRPEALDLQPETEPSGPPTALAIS
ncbi:MAG TPA: MATE family efflux transporter, partial [Polyangiaceae bacterium]|nr:MATE family efflux transporter [Polyangiaceae bacterium]